MLRLILATFLAFSPAARAEDNGIVALLPFDVTNANIDKATRQALEEAIRTVAGDALTPYGYTVLTGETTLAVLADNNIDAAKACEASCALQAARELKAKLFIAGTVTTSEGSQIAFIRVFESATGRQLAGVQLEGEKVRDLRKEFATRADTFFAKALGPRGTAPAPTPAPAATAVPPAPPAEPRSSSGYRVEEPSDPDPVRVVPAPSTPAEGKANVLALGFVAGSELAAGGVSYERAIGPSLAVGAAVNSGVGYAEAFAYSVTVYRAFGNYYLFGSAPVGLRAGLSLGYASVEVSDGLGTASAGAGWAAAYVGYELIAFDALAASLDVGYQAVSNSGSSGFAGFHVGYAF